LEKEARSSSIARIHWANVSKIETYLFSVNLHRVVDLTRTSHGELGIIEDRDVVVDIFNDSLGLLGFLEERTR
jgi:hypothetical protein